MAGCTALQGFPLAGGTSMEWTEFFTTTTVRGALDGGREQGLAQQLRSRHYHEEVRKCISHTIARGHIYNIHAWRSIGGAL